MHVNMIVCNTYVSICNAVSMGENIIQGLGKQHVVCQTFVHGPLLPWCCPQPFNMCISGVHILLVHRYVHPTKATVHCYNYRCS